MKKTILTLLAMGMLILVYKLLLKHSFKDLPDSPYTSKKNGKNFKRSVPLKKSDLSSEKTSSVKNQSIKTQSEKVQAEKLPVAVKNKGNLETTSVALEDSEYQDFLANGEFQEAMKHILKKSEEHISENPSREDFTQKLEVMQRYVKYNPEILKRDFGFFVGYYTLNAFDRQEEEVNAMDSLIEDYYKKEVANSSYCMSYFKEVAKKNVNYNRMSQVVFDCAANPRKRSIVHDYVNYLKQNKNENYAMEEYMKLRLLYTDLPEYGTYHQNL